MSLVVVLGKTMAYCLQINARHVKLELLCCHLMPSDIINYLACQSLVRKQELLLEELN